MIWRKKIKFDHFLLPFSYGELHREVKEEERGVEALLDGEEREVGYRYH